MAAAIVAELPNQISTSSTSILSKKKKKSTPNLSNLEYHITKAAWPIQPKVSSAKGRHVVALKAFEAGDLVAEEQTNLVMAANRDVCGNCFSLTNMETAKKLGTVDTCKGCSKLSYCSTKCQEAHSKDHSAECPVMLRLSIIATANEMTTDLLRFILLIIKRKSDVAENQAGKGNGHRVSTLDESAYVAPISSFFDVPTHRESFEKQYIKSFTGCAKAMKEALPQVLSNVSESELVDIACRVTNHVTTRPDPDQRIGDAAYCFYPLTVQLFKHSCTPNCSLTVFSNGHNVIRTLNPIQAGEELTICILDPYMPRADRHRALVEKHLGKCDCIRCRVPLRKSIDRYLDGIVCMECTVGVYLPEEEATKEVKERAGTLVKLKAEERNAKSDAHIAAALANGTEKKNKKHVAFNKVVETHVMDVNGTDKDEINELVEDDDESDRSPTLPYRKNKVEIASELKTEGDGENDSNHSHVHGENCNHDDEENDQDLDPEQREALQALGAKEREARTKQRNHKYYCELCGHVTHELEVRERLQSAKAELDQVMQILQIPQFNPAQLVPALKEFLGRFGAKNFPDMPVPAVAGYTSKESIKGALHPLNTILRDTRLHLLQILISTDDLPTALQLARDQLALYNTVHFSYQVLPPTWPEMGDMYHHMGDLLLRMANEKESSAGSAASARSRVKRTGAEEVLAKRYRSEAKIAYKKAYEIRKVCHGENHSKTVETRKRIFGK